MFAWFKPPQFPDETKTHQALILHVILWALIALPIPYTFFSLFFGTETPSRAITQAIVSEGINVFLMTLLRGGYVRLASTLQVAAFWVFVTSVAVTGTGVNGPAYLLGYGLVIVIAGVLLGGYGAAIATTVSLLSGALMAIGELRGVLSPVAVSPFGAYIPSLVLFPVSALLQNLAFRALSDALKRARASEERYRLISTVSSDYMFSTMLKGNGELELEWVAGAFETITGYSLEEYKAHGGWRSTVYPLDLDVDAFDMATLRSNKPVVSEIRTIHKNGELRWVKVYAQPVWDYQVQQLAGIHGAVQDITERKQADEALRKRDSILQAVTFAAEQFLKTPALDANINAVLARLGSVMNVTHAYIFVTHPGPDGEMVNSMRYEWAAPGYSLELDNPDFQNTPVKAEGFEDSYNALQRGEPYIGSSSTFQSVERDYFSSLGIKALLEMPVYVNGERWGIFGFDDLEKERDWSQPEIDALKIAANLIGVAIGRARADEEIHLLNVTLEQRVKERTAQLEQANKELESFSYSVSHDMRAPLRSVKGFSEILLREFGDQFDALARGYLEKISASATDMSELIDGLLTISRLSRSELRRTRLDLSGMAKALLRRLQQDDPARTMEWVVTDELYVDADPRLMQNVLENLIGNAWKYTSKTPNARIEVGTRLQDGKQVYFVGDNGAGFNMQYAGKLFGAFQRLHSAQEFPGHGIGLASVQRIIHRHGGRIWGEGEVGKGATFYFTLP